MGIYVVETEINRETIAQDCIQELGLQVFLFRMRRITRSHHRLASPFLNIFPRYLFVQFDLSEDKYAWPAIRRQRGVRRILSANPDGIPSAVREADFIRLKELAAELMKEVEINNGRPKPLAPETVVRVLFGPFQGFAGKIEIDNGIRADVLLTSAGVLSKITLPRELIEAV